MRRTAYAAALLLGLAPALAATQEDRKLVPDLAGLASLPQVTLPVAAVQKALRTQARDKGLPLKFAVGVPMPLGLADGVWDEADAATARWRLKLHSPGAVSLHLHFSVFRMPEGAELWFYDSAGKLVQGPLTSAHQGAGGPPATALVLGDTAALELRVPRERRNGVQLEISDAFHGYRDIRGAKDGFTDAAGPCEKDVICPEGNDWREQIRSVVLLQLANGLCSGQLVNNTTGDETPYVLTANHCEITPANAGRINAYFNVQSSTCGGSDGTLDQVVNGASFEAANERADTTLLRLRSQPPLAFNAYFSGWDARSSGGDIRSGAGIHHPQGDEKSISLFNQPASKTNDACFQENFSGQCVRRTDGWEVEWSDGATEVGSSGSGLWNRDKRLIGVLSGGASDCDGAVDNGLTDIYGRLEVAFGSVALRENLAPAGNSLVLDGKAATLAGDSPGTPDPEPPPGSPTGGLFSPGGGSGGGGGFAWAAIAIALFAGWLRSRLHRF